MNATATNKYLGWANRETWLASLWLNSAEDAYYILRESLDEDKDDVLIQARGLEMTLRDQLDNELIIPSLWSDLLLASFERINWLEIIKNNA